MRLLLVRHGESAGNVERRLQGWDDPLTERGRRQARELAAFLAARGDVAAIYTSPLPRALETARAIGEAVVVEPAPRDGLAEIGVGEAEGMRYDDWAARFPEEAERFRTGGVDYAWPGGESGRQVAARTGAEIDRIAAAHADGDGAVVVVSHGGALAWIVSHLLGEPGDEWPSAHMTLHNCSVSELLLQSGEPRVVAWVCRNDVGHLSPDPDAEVATGQTA